MKKLLLIAVVAFMAMPALAQQDGGDMRADAGLQYLASPFGGDGQIGFGAGFEYLFKENMSAAAKYTTSSKDGGTIGIFAIDYRYYFMTDGPNVYANAGFSFVSLTGASGNGLNFGAGAIFPVSDNIGINAALKYELQELQTFNGFTAVTERLGLNIQAGVVYNF